MSPLPIHGSATLFGLVIVAGCLIVAPARAYPAGVFLDCGAELDLCTQACDYSVPGGPALGKCNPCGQKIRTAEERAARGVWQLTEARSC